MSKQSDALRDFFEKNGILQKDVCEALGFTPATISNILAGRYQISKKVARKLSETYGLSMTFLITGDGELVPPRGVSIRRVDHVHNTGIINQTDGTRDEEISRLEQQLAQANAEKERLLGIIETLTQK